jgi:hypothetical protein
MPKDTKKAESFKAQLERSITSISDREVKNCVMFCKCQMNGVESWLTEQVVKHTTSYKIYMKKQENPEYVVQAILHPIFDGHVKYVVKWAGWHETTNEPLENISDTVAYDKYEEENENPQIFAERQMRLNESLKQFNKRHVGAKRYSTSVSVTCMKNKKSKEFDFDREVNIF